MTHPNLRHLYRMKDAARARSGNFCEYCALRVGDQLHHRHYKTFGRERHADVMLVCDSCHELISDKRACVVARSGSLADRGDTGRGMRPEWIAYLNGTRH